MESLTPFARKVLDAIAPDLSFQEQILTRNELVPANDSECMQEFTKRINQAIEHKEQVLVAGDYDADGILATSIMVDGLRKLGLTTGFYIPDRIREGYGLSAKTVQMAHDRNYSLIITVDNGVKADKALDKAAGLGVDVIVTDHHTFDKRPNCQVFVHPDLLGEEFSTLCGAAVAFECMRAMGLEDPKYLQFAAVASIGDCMRVTGETRAIIQQGLDTFNIEREPHLAALCKDPVVNETTVAFQIVPRINCVGRLANMANANNLVKYFLTEDLRQIYPFAMQVNELNETRKTMAEKVYEKANILIKPTRPVLLAQDYSFHEGIIGLAAGRLCQQYNKPAILGAKSAEGFKCSMRAPEGFDCMEFLGHFDGYSAIGGHALAAGFTVPFEKWEEFEKFVFTQGVKTNFIPQPKPVIDISPEEITVENIESLDALRPFGTGFELPQFELEHPRIQRIFDLGQGRHRKFSLPGGVQALNFNQSTQDKSASVIDIDKFIGTLSVNTFQGHKEPQFLIDEIVYQ